MRYLGLVALLALGCTDPDKGGGTGNGGNGGPITEPWPTNGDDDDLPTSEAPALVLNEYMPGNQSSINGPDGYSTPDYVELYNADDEAITLDRVEISADNGSWIGPADVAIQPGEYLLVWFDVAPTGADGVWTGFSLDLEGEEVTVYADGWPVGTASSVDLPSDVAVALTPDAAELTADVTGEMLPTAWATPGAANLPTASPTLNPADETVFIPYFMHQIEFEMTNQAYNTLDEFDRPEVHTAVTIDGIAYEDVGLKLKGSASYQTMDGKPAFVLDLNAWVLGTRFRGNRAFGLHNGVVLDPTRTRDYLSYQLARESGILASRTGWAEVYVNGDYYGIYMLIERVEEEFIAYRRPGDEETGMVFEGNETQSGGWATDFGGGNPNFDMEEGPLPPPAEALDAIERVDELVAQSATDDRVAELWTHVNKQQFLRYVAWETVVMHTDGYRAPNNWRFYIDPNTYQLEWIPAGVEWTWDANADFEGGNGGVSSWCVDNTQCKYDLALEVLAVADVADSLYLHDQFLDLSAWLDPYIDSDPRYSGAWQSVDDARSSTSEHLQTNPQGARQDVYNAFPVLAP